MSATFFPSINNRMDRSVPKFGARCTINRPVGCPLLDVVASVAETRTAKTAAALKKSLGKTFIAPNLSRCRLFPLSTLTISLPRSITVSQTALPPARAAPPLARVLTLIRLSPARSLLSLDSIMSVSALRILAVDNEPSVTCSLRYIFTGPRYELSAVENGDAALARRDSGLERYDVIIVDEKMPHMTGVELVGELRKRQQDHDIVGVPFVGRSRRLRAHGRARHVPKTIRRRPTADRRRSACSLISVCAY